MQIFNELFLKNIVCIVPVLTFYSQVEKRKILRSKIKRNNIGGDIYFYGGCDFSILFDHLFMLFLIYKPFFFSICGRSHTRVGG